MPVRLAIHDGVIHTMLVGRVTDEELLAHYTLPALEQHLGAWLELVDGREITDMAVSPEGQRKLAGFVELVAERLRGGRVAMVAADDLTFGMFRMWELQREGLGYGVRVFRDVTAALEWVKPASTAD